MSIKNLRYVIFAGLFAVPFIPLIIAPSLLFPFITGKAFIFRLIVEIIFACWLGLMLKNPEYRPRFSSVSFAVALFLAVIGLADLFSANPFKSFWSNYERMEGYIALLHFAAFFFVLSSTLKGKDLWNKFFATNVFVSGIMAIYSFLQLAHKITINQGGVRVDGTFGNATYLGIYMVFCIFFAAYLYVNTDKKIYKYLLGLVALMDLVVLYYTATRGAILGLIGGGLITFFILLMKSEKGDGIRKVALISIVAIFAFVGVFLISRNNSYVMNNPVLGRFATLSLSELQTQGRFYVWPIAWKGFLERPILGWGQESFNFVFNKYYNPKMYDQEPWFDRTHDIVLDWLIAGGLLGLLSYLYIFWALLQSLFKKGSSYFKKEEKAIFAGLLAAYVFHNLFVFDQIGSYILFFSILAFVHSISAGAESSSPNWIKRWSSSLKSFFEKESIYPVVSSLVVIATASTLYFWMYIPWKENLNLIKALLSANQQTLAPIEVYKTPLGSYNMGFSESLEHISDFAVRVAGSTNVDQNFKQQLFSTVDTSFKQQLARVPGDARYRLFYGLFLSGYGDANGALLQFEEAGKLSPTKQTVHFEIGSTLIALGKKEEALEEFKKAYDLDHSYLEARLVYGLTALSVGDEKLAGELLAPIDKNKLIFDDRYISVLAGLKRFNEVIAISNERIKSDPTNMQYRITLAAAYLQSGQRNAAVGVIQDMVKINPTFKEQGEYYIKEIQAGRNP